MVDMDVKIIPDEGPDDNSISNDEFEFEHHKIPEHLHAKKVDAETDITRLVKMKFPNFAKLVATHSFEDVLENNRDEDIIIPADLLADLANADFIEDEQKKRTILVLAGIALGILIAFVFLGGF